MSRPKWRPTSAHRQKRTSHAADEAKTVTVPANGLQCVDADHVGVRSPAGAEVAAAVVAKALRMASSACRGDQRRGSASSKALSADMTPGSGE